MPVSPRLAQAFLYTYITIVRYNQPSFMLSLEVVGPGGSLSTVLVAMPYRRDASWRVSWQATTATAAYVQLRPDDYGAPPSAGERLAAATTERTGFVGDGF